MEETKKCMEMRVESSSSPMTPTRRETRQRLGIIFLAPRLIPSPKLHISHSKRITIIRTIYTSMAVCVSCNRPLVLELDSSEDEDHEMGGASSSGKAPAAAPETVPDDVHLNCGCHFHWYNSLLPAQLLTANISGSRDCLLTSYQITSCPSCSTHLVTSSPSNTSQILCTLHNEGGLQENLDILPLLTEETYLKAYPEERKCRAFLEFCREGDVKAIVEMLQDDEEEDEDESMQDVQAESRTIGADELLRYQDPIGDMQSGLHAAVQAGSRDVAWLLLLLASNLDLLQFPPEVFQEAEVMGVMRGDMEGKTDIRSLRDADGKLAEDLAREMGGVWTGWPGTGRLTI